MFPGIYARKKFALFAAKLLICSMFLDVYVMTKHALIVLTYFIRYLRNIFTSTAHVIKHDETEIKVMQRPCCMSETWMTSTKPVFVFAGVRLT